MSSATQASTFPILAVRRLARPAMVVVGGTLAVKLMATVKEAVVAGAFGRSDAMDAFLAAMLIPGLLINLTAESMSQALVPAFIQARVQNGAENARELLAAAFARLVMLLLGASAIAGLTAPWWIRFVGWGFSAAKLDLTLHLFWGLLPFVLFAGLAGTAGAVLNALGRYGVPVFAPAIVPLFTIAFAACASLGLASGLSCTLRCWGRCCIWSPCRGR